MTNAESIHSVKRLFREINADSRLPDRLVYSLLQKHLRWLVYTEGEKLKLTKLDTLFQKKKCVKVIEAPLVDSCCGIKSYCKIWRTEEKLPEIMEDNKGVLIRSINTIDGLTGFTLVSAKDMERKINNPWIKNLEDKKYYYYSDGYIYFPYKHYPMVEIEAYFTEAVSSSCENFSNSNSTASCKRFLDEKWICPEYLEARVIDAVIKELSNTYKRIREASHEINSNDNVQP